jgi:hypothetical protein
MLFVVVLAVAAWPKLEELARAVSSTASSEEDLVLAIKSFNTLAPGAFGDINYGG